MDIGKTLYVYKRKDWRSWLQKNFDTADEIWLIFPKKISGIPCIVYNDAVEEALCFGWIDSIRKSLDKNNSAQRFSRRREKSNWSQTNKVRLRWLLKNNLVHESLIRKYKKITKEKFIFPKDIISQIKKNKKAWENYQNFSLAYQEIRIAYINDARSENKEFKKRLTHFIDKTEENKMIGYGGIEKYY